MENEQEHTKEVEQHETAHHKKKRMSAKSTQLTIISIIIVIVFVIVGGIIWLYTGQLTAAKSKVFNNIPLPAAIVDMKFIPAKTVIQRVDLAKQLQQMQGTGVEAKASDTYDQLLDGKKIEAVATNHSVSTTSKAIDDEYQNIIKQYANGDEGTFKSELEKTYKMTGDQFKTEVIRQQLLQSELMLWFNKQENLNQKAYDTAKDLQSKISSGQSFDDIAKAYTQDEATKDFAGDSGVIGFDQLLPEFQDGLKDTKVGDIKTVPSRYGLHILKVLEVNNDGANGAKQIHLQQIYVKTSDFATWLKQEEDSVRVIKLLKF